MRYAFAALCALPILGGCSDLSKIIPGASAKFATDLQTERTLAAQLASDFRVEDKTLRFLSAEGYQMERGYSCGDPRDPRFRLLPAAKGAVKKDNAHLSAALENALKTLDTYNQALKDIQTGDDDAKAALKTLNGLIKTAASIPGTPSFGAVADAGLPVANNVVDFVALGYLVDLARRMQKPLQDAATVIRANMTELTGAELIAFRLWDECARETLVYLREVPRGTIAGYPSHVGQSSGVELQMAYQGYLAKRAGYQSPNLREDLQAILDQNAILANGITTTPDNLIAALGNAITFANSLNSAVTPTASKAGS
jgi:hypothetical protein